MPKFVYSVGILILLLTGGLFAVVSNLNPSVIYAKPLFLVLLFGIAFLIASLVAFFINIKKQSFFTDTRKIYRKGLKTAFFFGLIATGLAWLKIYSLLTLITSLLFLAFIFSFAKLSSGNRR